MMPVVLGGLAYTAGAAVEWAEPPPLIGGVIRAHELFHLAVLIGLALHWRFIWLIAPMNPNAGTRRPDVVATPLSTARPGRAPIPGRSR